MIRNAGSLLRLARFDTNDFRAFALCERRRRPFDPRIDSRLRSRIRLFELGFDRLHPGIQAIPGLELGSPGLRRSGFLTGLGDPDRHPLDSLAGAFRDGFVRLGARLACLGTGDHIRFLGCGQGLTLTLES